MSQEEEPSIIDYARFYGLIRDHFQPHPLQVIAASDSPLPLELDDDAGLAALDLAEFRLPNERLTVDAGAASLLSSIATSAKEEPSRGDNGIGTHRIGKLKHELPLLRSDHELDLLSFGPQIVPDLEHEFLPLESVDEEADEGLAWPSSCYHLPAEFAKKSTSEKLQLSSDVLRYLQDTLNIHLQIEGAEDTAFDYDNLSYKKRKLVEPLSPPLLPQSPIASPFVPSSETGHLDLLSDHTSPTREEARNVERMLFDEDSIQISREKPDPSSQFSDPLLKSESLGDIYSPLKGIKDPPSSPPPLRAPLQDRKVEVPLSPVKSERGSLSKTKSVSFSVAVAEFIPEFLPPPIPKPEETSSSDIDVFFDEVIAPIGLKAERTIEQEQLQEEDTTLRVPVPVMDFSLPVTPWAASLRVATSNSGEALYKVTLAEMRIFHFSKHVWPMSGKAERELKWAPFPSALGRVENQERIPDDGSADKYLAQPERVDVNTFTWKPEGLRILDDLYSSDEEELEEGRFPEEKNLESLIRKRKLELEEFDSMSTASARNFYSPKESPPSKRHAAAAVSDVSTHSREHVEGAEKSDSRGVVFTNSFSGMGALDDYLSIRKGIMVKPKPKANHHLPSPDSERPTGQPKRALEDDNVTAGRKNQVLPLPKPIPPTTPCLFVVSASFLQDRKLSRKIQSLFPSAELVERDFNLYLDPQLRPPPKSNTTPPIISSMAHEADIILSPSTGLIWTTLQKIKQRSLPGQADRSAIRERVLAVSPRYERLLLLVSVNHHEDDPGGANQLDTSDCEALIELTSFCASLQDEVQVTLIGGGEEQLAGWIVAMMVNYGIADQEVKLIHDETLWEIFLRRAGMNAFAAQAILGQLKAPDQNVGVSRDWGLPRFVKMSAEERCERFETLLGGRRLLARVGRVLDARW